jgi:hypothetical protein
MRRFTVRQACARRRSRGLLTAALTLLSMHLLPAPASAQQKVTADADLAQVTSEAANDAILELAGGRFNGPLVVDGKTLTLRGAADGSSIVATDRAEAVLIVTNGGRAILENIVFEADGKQQMGGYVNAATLEMSGGGFRNSGDDGIYSEGGKLALTDVTIEDIADIAIIGQKGAEITASKLRLARIGGAGIHLQEGARLDVSESLVIGRSAIAALGGTATISLRQNDLVGTSPDHPALAFEQGAEISLAGNTISAPGDALYLAPSPATVINLRDNLVFGATRSGIAIDAREPLTAVPALSGNLLLLDGADENAYGIYLAGNMRAQLDANRIALRKGMGLVIIRGASAESSNDVVIADTVALRFSETDGTATKLTAATLLPAEPVEGVPASDTATAARNAALDPAHADALRQARDQALAMVASGAPAPTVTARSYFDALEQELSGLQNAASAMGSVTLMVRDAVGREGFASFGLLDSAGNEISHHDTTNPVASVPAGTYLVSPDFDPFQNPEAVVAAGADVALKIDLADALWVTIKVNDEKGPTTGLMKLRPPAQRKAIAANIRRAHDYTYLAEPRAGATAADFAAARDLARAWLHEEREAKKPASNEDREGWSRHSFATLLAHRIIGLTGDADDVADLVAEIDTYVHFSSTGGPAMALARIESRLGTLADGALARFAQSDKAGVAIGAMILLHRHGIHAFDDALRAAMANPPDAELRNSHIYDYVHAMLDDDSPQTHAVIRQLWQAYQDRQAELDAMDEAQRKDQWNAFMGIREIGMVWFLAHGTPEDWARLPLDNVDFFVSTSIAAFAADAGNAAALLLPQFSGSLIYGYASHLSVMDEPDLADAFGMLADAMFSIGFEHAVKAGEYDPGRVAEGNVNSFYGHSSAFYPNDKMPEFFYFGGERLNVDPLPWVPFPWSYAEVVDLLLKGNSSPGFTSQLGFMTADEFATLLAEKNTAAVLPAPDLLLAYTRVATRASWIEDLTDYGRMIGNNIEWQRPFALKQPSTQDHYGGAVMGRLEFRPRFVEDELRLRLDLPRQAFYHEYCSLAAKISTDCNLVAWLIHPAMNDPELLVTGIRLVRGDTEIPLTLRPSANPDPDQLIYAAAVPGRDLTDLRAEITLSLGEDRRTFTFTLYDGPLAWRERRAGSAIAAARDAAAASPEDVAALRALAEAERAAGHLEAAWAAWQQVLARDPAAGDLWHEASNMFADAGLMDRAAAVYEAATAANPADMNLRFSLASMQYQAGQYGAAATSYGAVVAAAPEDHEARTWLGHAQFLARDWAGAAASYGALPANMRSLQIDLLALVAATEAAGATLADPAAFDATLQRLRAPPEGETASPDPCHGDFYGGYRLRFTGDGPGAKTAFDRARGACRPDSLEGRALAAMSE